MNDSDLDISWIDKEKRLHSIEHHYCREFMESISIHIVFINHHDSGIEKITSEKYDLDVSDNKQFISKERLLKIVQTNKTAHQKKYKLFDMALFNVDLEPQHIQDYANNMFENNHFFKSFSMIHDIVIPPSIFIFHSLNAIYLFMKEVEPEDTIRSILKKTGDGKKHTKRVRIMEEAPPKNKTKKHLSEK